MSNSRNIRANLKDILEGMLNIAQRMGWL